MKSVDGLPPRDRASVVDEGLAPVLGVTVAALINEYFELPIRDLESIDPEVVDLADVAKAIRAAAFHHAHHPGRCAVDRIQPVTIERARCSRALNRLKSIF